MKIIITGGAGFIGYHLSRSFLEDGHYVEVWDNFYTGRVENIQEINSNKFSFQNYDIRDFHESDCDVIINLACPASPIHYQKDPIYTWETSVIGTSNLVKLAEKNCAIFMQASTSEVYGDPLVHPQVESYWGNVNPIGLRSCYDEGKRAAETLIFDYMRARNLDARVFRIFNTYGPYMDKKDGRVISNFCNQALEGKKLTIFGDGLQTRSFCYVSDLVLGIKAMLYYNDKIDKPINLGNHNEFKVIDLVGIIEKELNIKLDIQKLDLPSDDPKVRKPDLSRAKSILGWYPKVTLQKGISKTIAYFKEH